MLKKPIDSGYLKTKGGVFRHGQVTDGFPPRFVRFATCPCFVSFGGDDFAESIKRL